MKKHKYNMGLCLSSGGTKGFAHLGVMEALNERGIVPDVIAGSSVGAFVGALYADGYAPREILDLFENKAFSKFVKLVIPKGGLFNTAPFRIFLKSKLRAKNFDELKIPLIVVATDIEQGETKVFDQGDLIKPVLASCTFPIIFNPVKIGKRHYVDGGVLKRMPASVIREDCKILIGVNVYIVNKTPYKNSLFYIAERTFKFMSFANMTEDREMCDYLIESEYNLNKYGFLSVKRRWDVFEIGYNIGKKFLEKEGEKLLSELK